jgi:hypothetical protein
VAVRSSGIDTRPVLHFHGNTGAHVSGSTAEADCTGVGAVDISACNGPFLLESAQLSPNPAASWTVAAPLFNGTADRNIYDPNWIWNVTKPTTLAGPLTVDFWAACSGCSDLLLAADWIVRLWADGVKVAEQHVSGTPLLPNVPEKQSVTIEIPMVRATSNFVLHVDPVYLIDNARSVIFYDSSQPCPGANSTEPCDSVVRVPIDKTPPIVTAPVTTIGTGAVANGGLPVRVTWSGTDDATGVARYDLQLATGNTYSTVALAKPTATSHVLTLTPGSTYRFRVRATDGAGNTSAFVAGPNFTVGIVGQTDAAVQYTGRWTSANQIGATNGTVKYARAAGATARYTFTGNSVAWMSTLGADRGLAEIWLDGENAGVVDLYSAQTRASALVFSRSGLASNGTHTLVVKVLNTKNKASSGTRVDVDGFAVVR